MGDLIVYGEGRGDWGEMYSQFIDLTARSYAQLSQAARVSRTFPPGAMRQYASDLRWTHHRVLISTHRDERLGLLRQARENEWTADTLRQAARDSAALTTSDGEPEEGRPLVEVLAAPSVGVLVTCVNDESAAALRAWCEQFPAEFTCANA